MIKLFLSNNDDHYKADKTLETFETFTITYSKYDGDMLRAVFHDIETGHQVARIIIDLKYDREWHQIIKFDVVENRHIIESISSYEYFVATLSKERPDIMAHLLWFV